MSFQDSLARYAMQRGVLPPGQDPLGSSTPMPPSAAELALAARLTSVYGHPGNLGSSVPMPAPTPADLNAQLDGRGKDAQHRA